MTILLNDIEIPNPEPITRIYRHTSSVKPTVTGLLSIQAGTVINLGWKIKFSASTRAAIEAIYNIVTAVDLEIDGVTYPNVVITDREDVVESALLDDFSGGITLTQSSFLGGGGSSPDEEQFINGGFELGALTSWGTSGGGISASANALYEGEYGCELNLHYDHAHTIYQTVDLTDVEDITYAVRIRQDNVTYPPELYNQVPMTLTVTVGGTTVRTVEISDLDTWHTYTDDVSSYTGSKQVVFSFTVPSPDAKTYGCHANIDSISAIKPGSSS